MTDPIVGIDLGTTNSVVAHVDDAGKVTVLADEKGFKIQPSVVSFHPNGSVVIGAPAKQRRVIDPKNTVYSAKRLIGRTYGSREVQQAALRAPYTIKEGLNEQPVIVTRAGEFAIPEISAIVLDHMRSIAKRALGGIDVGRAVVTVPANFTEAQRSATATAGAIAGLTVVRVLNEPTAAALAYGHLRRTNEVIAVYDFGGGTFDCSILELRDDVYQVLATAGDTFLGGDDIDERLVDVMVAAFLKSERIDLRADELAMQRLRMVAEQTKIELSRRARAVIRVDEIAYGPGGAPLNLSLELTRDDLVSRVTDLVDKTFAVCKEALGLAALEPAKIAEVVLVGGTTKMPYVRERVGAFFARTPRTDVNPDEAVAVGAALQAAAMARVLGAEARPAARATAPLPTSLDQGAPAPPVLTASSTSPTLAPGSATASAAMATAPTMYGRPATATPPATPPATRTGRRAAVPARDTSPRVASPDERAAHPPVEVSLRGEAVDDTTVLDPEEPTGIRYSTRARPTSVPPPIPPRAAPTRSTQPQFPGPTPPATPPANASPAAAPGAAADRRPPVTMPMTAARRPDQPTLMPQADPVMQIEEVDTDVVTLPEVMPGAGSGSAAARTLIGATLPTPARPPTAPAPTLAAANSPPAALSTTSPGPPPVAPFSMSPPAQPSPAPPFSMSPPAQPSVPAAAQWTPERSVLAVGAATLSPSIPAPARVPAIAQERGPAIDQKRGPANAHEGVPEIDPFPSLPPLGPSGPAYSPERPLAPIAGITPAPRPAASQAARGPAPVTPAVIDVLPNGLGVGTVGGFCEEILQRNRRVPAEHMRVFATARDQQTSVHLRIYRGSSRRAVDNALLGDLVLDGLEPRPRGEIRIAVTFQVDASGILHVRARDQKSGAERQANLSVLGAQSPQEIAAAQGRLRDLRGQT